MLGDDSSRSNELPKNRRLSEVYAETSLIIILFYYNIYIKYKI